MNTLFFLLLALSLGEIGAQFFLKNSVSVMENKNNILSNIRFLSSSSKKYLLLLIGMLVYAFVGYLFWETLQLKSFGVAGLLWHLSMVLLTIIISIFYFNDKYTMRDVIGMIFGIISLVLLMNGNHSH